MRYLVCCCPWPGHPTCRAPWLAHALGMRHYAASERAGVVWTDAPRPLVERIMSYRPAGRQQGFVGCS